MGFKNIVEIVFKVYNFYYALKIKVHHFLSQSFSAAKRIFVLDISWKPLPSHFLQSIVILPNSIIFPQLYYITF